VDIVERAAQLCDELVVAVGVNSDKQPFLPPTERCEALRECLAHLPNVRVEVFSGLLVRFAKEQGCQFIVRGLRAISDFDYEFRVSLANRSLDPTIETVFLLTREEYSFLASSVVREVAALGGPIDGFVPEPVARRILARDTR
jgi:pantetheine-phosphate adenylyltransferase